MPHQLSPALIRTLEIGGICNNANSIRSEDGSWAGQSTDVALLNVLDAAGLPEPRQGFTRTQERPFNSEQKYMTVSGTRAGGEEAHYMKGAIESVLSRCRYYHVSDDSQPPLDTQTKSNVLAKAQEIATRGLRVIAMAYTAPGFGSTSRANSRAPSPSPGGSADERSDLIFAGFTAMLDPPRKGVSDAIALLQNGGVQVVMITGDSEETARAIAKDLGLASRGTMTGAAVDAMTMAQLTEKVGSVSVFARTTPRHKMKIVEAFQSRGAVVAMTGDGGTPAVLADSNHIVDFVCSQ